MSCRLFSDPRHWLKADNETVREPTAPFMEALGTEQRSKYSRPFPWQWNGWQAGWTRVLWWCVNEGEEQASLEDLQSNRIVNCRRMVWEHRTCLFGPVCVIAFERMLLFYMPLTRFYCLCCVSACPFKEFKAMHYGAFPLHGTVRLGTLRLSSGRLHFHRSLVPL